MPKPAGILDQDDLMALMGYERVGDVERALIDYGIKPVRGKKGRIFITYGMLEQCIQANNQTASLTADDIID